MRRRVEFCPDREHLFAWCLGHMRGHVLAVADGLEEVPVTAHSAWCEHLHESTPGDPVLTWAWACFEAQEDLRAFAATHLGLVPQPCPACCSPEEAGTGVPDALLHAGDTELRAS